MLRRQIQSVSSIYKYCHRLVLLLIVVLPVSLLAQHPFYYQLNDENGLPSNEVYQTIQDPSGQLWIGCDAGLFRYDGFRFVQYRSTFQNGRSISGLQLDTKGRIWCRNFNGQIYRVEADSLRIIVPLSALSANNSFILDTHCNAWFIDQEYVCCVNDQGKIIRRQKLQILTKRPKETTPDIQYFEGYLYFTQIWSGPYRYNLKNGKTEKLAHADHTQHESSRNLFFTYNKELYLFSEHTQTKSYTISKIHETRILPLKEFRTDSKNILVYLVRSMNDGTFWACTSNGVFNAMGRNTEIDHIRMLFDGIKISNVFRDREGIHWFSSLDQGIFVVPSLEVTKQGITPDGIRNQDINCFLSSGNELIAGDANGGIFRTDGSFQHIRYDVFESEFKFRAVKKIIRYQHADFISHGPLSVIRNGKSTTYPLHYLRDFCIVRDTLFFVNSEYCGAISLDDLFHNRIKNYRILRRCGGRTIVYHPDEHVFYINCNDGLYRLDHMQWIPVRSKGNQPLYCSDLALHNRKIWAATISQGIAVIANGAVERVFDMHHGLVENDIKLIRSSGRYIWACGNQALYKIDPATGKTGKYYKLSGIIPTSVKNIGFFQGYVILATSKGIVRFPEQMEWKNTVPPTLRLLHLEADGRFHPSTHPVTFPYDTRNIRIALQSISFRSQGNFVIRYRIRGLSEHFTTVPASTQSIGLSSLPSGEYVLEVQSMNENGIGSPFLRIPVTVRTPFWRKWWFITLVVLTAAGIIYFSFLYRFRYLQRKAETREKLVFSQLTALKAQMNPHFMYNALNSIQDLVIEKDIRNSNFYLSRFSLLMRRILDASGTESIALADEMEILELYLELEKLRFGNEFTFAITTDPALSVYDTLLPSMILQPFVENAIKHGLLHKKGPKLLTIHFSLEDDLICTITDNGIGRKHAEAIRKRQLGKHKSFATEATEKRIELLNSLDQRSYRFDILDLEENGEPAGTKVIIRLPL